MNVRGRSRGHPRGRSRGGFRGPTRGHTRGPTRGVKFRSSRALCSSDKHCTKLPRSLQWGSFSPSNRRENRRSLAIFDRRELAHPGARAIFRRAIKFRNAQMSMKSFCPKNRVPPPPGKSVKFEDFIPICMVFPHFRHRSCYCRGSHDYGALR